MQSILIVDDSSSTRNRIERIATQYNLKVVGTAKNGLEAINQYREFRPDFVTLDLTMPEMNGIECIKKLIEEDPQAVILVISAAADKGSAIKAIDCGARGFVNKPFADEALIEAFEKLISASQ